MIALEKMETCTSTWGDYMATSIERTLEVNYDNADLYIVPSSATCGGTVSGTKVALRLSGTSGRGTLNDAAMDVLYPSATAHPYSADSFISCIASSSNISNLVTLSFNGSTLQTVLCSLKQGTQRNITSNAVTTSTHASTIRWNLNAKNIFNMVGLTTAYITLRFWQYTVEPQMGSGAAGIRKMYISDPSPYDGDPVTVEVELSPTAQWHGWYADYECTQLLTTDQSYSTTASEDLVLYAYATEASSSTGLFVKFGGTYSEVRRMYMKIAGKYVEQEDIPSILQTTTQYEKGDTL